MSIHFCEKVGLDYVSCSPFRVPIARLAAAQAAIALGSQPRAKSSAKSRGKAKPTRSARPRACKKLRAKSKPAARLVRTTAKARTKPRKTRDLVTV